MSFGLTGLCFEIMKEEDTLAAALVSWLIFTSTPIMSTFAMISIIIKQREFLLTLELIRSVDLSLKEYGSKINYQSDYMLLYLSAMAVPICGVLEMVFEILFPQYARHQNPVRFLYEACILGPGIWDRQFFIMIFAVVARMLTQQFSHLNNLFVKMGCYDTTFDNNDNKVPEKDKNTTTYETFQSLMRLHQDSCSAMKQLNLAFGVIMLPMMSGSVVFIVISIYLSLRHVKSVGTSLTVFGTAINMCHMIIVLWNVELLYSEVGTKIIASSIIIYWIYCVTFVNQSN